MQVNSLYNVQHATICLSSVLSPVLQSAVVAVGVIIVCTGRSCRLVCLQGFFRRTVKEREGLQYVCNKGGACTITTSTRNICKACRYNKCLQVGMTPDGSRIGRQPNSVKHRTMLELASLRNKHQAPTPVRNLSMSAKVQEA